MSKFVIAVKEYGVMSDQIKSIGVDEITDMIDVISNDYNLSEKAEESFKDMIDQVSTPMQIGDVSYYASGHLKEIDGIMYQTLLDDHIQAALEDLDYEIKHDTSSVINVQILNIDMSIIRVDEYKKGPWIMGIRSEDFNRCTLDYVFNDIPDLIEHITTEEYSQLRIAFAEYFDDIHGKININGVVYYASEILEEFDISEHYNQLIDWLTSIIKKNVIDVVDNYHITIVPYCEKYAVFKVRSEAFN